MSAPLVEVPVVTECSTTPQPEIESAIVVYEPVAPAGTWLVPVVVWAVRLPHESKLESVE